MANRSQITLVRIITVKRQWVITVQYRAILRHDSPLPVNTNNHRNQILTSNMSSTNAAVPMYDQS